MDHEQAFRLILIAGFVTVFPVGLYHRLRSQATGEKLDRSREGLFILLTLRPLAAVRMVGVITWLIDPAWMAWSAVALPIWLRWCAVGLGIVTAALLIWTFRTLDTNLTDTVVTRKNHTLVTVGPYRWVRHPFYFAFLMAMIADSLMLANWFLALTGGLAVSLIFIRTAREEANLLSRFGDDYRQFMETTGRFFPRLGG